MDSRKLKIVFTIALIPLIVMSCSSGTPTNEPEFVPTIIAEESPTPSQDGLPRTEAEVPRVSPEDALAALQSEEAVVVDVRSLESYQASHIAGAISIPLGEVETNPTGLNLDKDEWIITYCT